MNDTEEQSKALKRLKLNRDHCPKMKDLIGSVVSKILTDKQKTLYKENFFFLM